MIEQKTNGVIGNKMGIDNDFRSRIEKIINKLNDGLLEREITMNLTFISAIAGESIFMLGLPGVAKSLIARRLKYAFKDARSFEYLMHRFSTPDEVFGPNSIAKLKNEDKLERNIEKYLPGANIAFLDEIWKAGPAIQNTLLTIINEKIFRNGEQELNVDLYGLLAASNELPEENMGLEALWDRFIIRTIVNPIKDKNNFEKMITSTKNLYKDPLDENDKISKEEYMEWHKKINQILVPNEILKVINFIRVKIEKYNQKLENQEVEEVEEDETNQVRKEKTIYISDRRWKKIIKCLRTIAFLNGRKKIDLMDCFLMIYMMWEEPSHIKFIKNIVKDAIKHNGYDYNAKTQDIEKFIKNLDNEIKKETEIPNGELKKYIINGLNFIKIKNTDEFIKDNSIDEISAKEYNNIELHNSKGRYQREIRIKLNNNLENDYSFHQESTKKTMYFEAKENVIRKKPLQVVIEDWDKKINNILNNIQELLKTVNDYEESELAHLKINLFVKSEKAKIILEKIDKVKENIHKLEIRTKEIQERYHNID